MFLNIKVTGKGFPVVLFHGWGFDHQIWLQLAQDMRNSYQLFLVDLPGFGMSSPMSWAYFKARLLQRLPRYFALAGWSMGGLFATRLAIEEPTRVSCLINIASSPRFIKDEQWPGVEKNVFAHFFSNLTTQPELTLSQFVALQLKNQHYQYQNNRLPDPASLQEGLHILADWDLREQLQHFAKPTYFLFGRLDAIVPRTTMAVMQKNYPQFAYKLFAKAAHIPFLSEQDEFITLFKDMLQ